MARTGTPNWNLGMHDQGDNPGAGSKTVDNDGVNGTLLKIDKVGVGHNPDGSHKANIIEKSHLNTNVADGSTIERDATNGLQIVDGGVTGVKFNANTVDDSTIELSSNQLQVKDAGIVADKLATDAVETAKIADDAVTTEKLEYKEYVAVISQTGTNDPVATVIKNTLSGTPTFSRSSAGAYTMTLTNEWTVSKTVTFIDQEQATYIEPRIHRSTVSVININVYQNSGTTLIDGWTASVIVRVYP